MQAGWCSTHCCRRYWMCCTVLTFPTLASSPAGRHVPTHCPRCENHACKVLIAHQASVPWTAQPIFCPQMISHKSLNHHSFSQRSCYHVAKLVCSAMLVCNLLRSRRHYSCQLTCVIIGLLPVDRRGGNFKRPIHWRRDARTQLGRHAPIYLLVFLPSLPAAADWT